jgi:hypothetical protein
VQSAAVPYTEGMRRINLALVIGEPRCELVWTASVQEILILQLLENSPHLGWSKKGNVGTRIAVRILAHPWAIP